MSTRQRRTPQARAEQALGVATRQVDRLTKTRDRHRDALAATETQLTAARRRRDYLATSPDLPQQPEPSTNPTGEQE